MANQFRKRLVPITIGVSGHIDIAESDIETASREFAGLIEQLASKFPHTPVQLLVSLAVGADRVAAECFLKFRASLQHTQPDMADRYELVVVLPMAAEQFKSDFPENLSQFHALIDEADAVVVMPLRRNITLDDIKNAGEARNRQYQDATRYISVHSDILVAFWDGNNPNKIGGTHDAILMRLFGHAVTDEIHYSPLANAATRFVLHIPVTRNSTTTEREIETRFIASSKFKTSADQLIEAFHDGHELDEFNASVLSKINDQRFQKSLQYLCNAEILERFKSDHLDYSAKFAIELYATADALSIRSEKRWNFLTKSIYGFGFGTSVMLPIAIEDIFLPWSMLSYISMLIFAFGVYSWMRMTRLENQHVESRALAEFLRVQIVWLHCGFDGTVAETRHDQSPGYYFPPNVSTALLGQQLINIGWIGRILTSLVILPKSDTGALRKTGNHSLVNDWIDGQLIYFQKSQAHAELAAHKIRLFSKLFVFCGLISAFAAIFMSHFEFHNDLVHRLLIIGAAAFPIMSVVLENFSENLAIEAKAKINERLFDVFESAKNLISNPDTPQAVKNSVIIEVGKEAVAEAMMWFFLRRSKPTKITI